jgi:hypothetical protein
VRVWFDDGELLKLKVRADSEGNSLPDYVRNCVLREPRRVRQPAVVTEDLFAHLGLRPPEATRELNRRSPDLEERILAYVAADDVLKNAPGYDPDVSATERVEGASDLIGIASEPEVEAPVLVGEQPTGLYITGRDELGTGIASGPTSGSGKRWGFFARFRKT